MDYPFFFAFFALAFRAFTLAAAAFRASAFRSASVSKPIRFLPPRLPISRMARRI